MILGKLVRVGAFGTAVIGMTLQLSACGAGTRQLTSQILPDLSKDPCPNDPDKAITHNKRGLYEPDLVCSVQILRAVQSPGVPQSGTAAGGAGVVIVTDNGGTVSLAELSPIDVKLTASQADQIGLSKGWISAALSDSQTKCEGYLGQFTGLQSAENTGFDVTALILSGLASVFTPVNTVRALAAASTAVQGTKAAINTDLYQQATTVLFMQQIETTYFKQFQDIAQSPPASAQSAALAIQSMHSRCSFLRALVGIADKTASGSGSQSSDAPAKLDLSSLAAGSYSYVGADETTFRLTVSSDKPAKYTMLITSPKNISLGTRIYGTDYLTPQGLLNADTARAAK